jgi:adenylate cyclase
MLRVRTKLLLVVVACAVPAAVAVVLGAWQAREALYDQARTQLEGAELAFVAELDDVLSSAELAVQLAAEESSLAAAVAARRDGAPARVVRSLRVVYREAAVVVTDRDGAVVATSEAGGALASRTELAPLRMGRPVVAAAQLPDLGFRILVGRPLTLAGEPVGALVLALPFGARDLDAIRWKLQTDFAVHLDGAHVALTSHHPLPGLDLGVDDGIRFVREAERTAVADAFRPPQLQTPGHVLGVVALQDVTALRAGVIRQLLLRLAIVGAAALLGVGLALVLSRRIAGAVGRVAEAAEAVRAGRYARVDVLATRDELESLSRTFNEMVHGLEDRDRIRDTFGRYVSRQVAERLLGGQVNLGGETLAVTVLFSDIRGFTGISERMDPRELLDFLNVYFTAMVDTVLEHEGVVDKFMGDGMMAVFGAPTPREDDALRAVKAALRMRATLAELNRRFEERGQPAVRIGIGIHTGPVVAGNIGHEERKQYTVIGDSVNVASRLESLTKEYAADILVSEDTFARVRSQVEAEPLEEVRVKGRQQPLRIYRVVGLAAEPGRAASGGNP